MKKEKIDNSKHEGFPIPVAPKGLKAFTSDLDYYWDMRVWSYSVLKDRWELNGSNMHELRTRGYMYAYDELSPAMLSGPKAWWDWKAVIDDCGENLEALIFATKIHSSERVGLPVLITSAKHGWALEQFVYALYQIDLREYRTKHHLRNDNNSPRVR